MAMRNITGKVMDAFYALLSGLISVPVYRVDAPNTETGNYVLLRMESETGKFNNNTHVTSPVIITEVVTKFSAAIDDALAGEIDDEIAQLLHPGGPGSLNIADPAGVQIVEVKRQNATYFPEDDGTFKYHRLITRNVCRVLQV